MNKLGTKLGAIAMSAVMALSFAPSAAITSLAAGGDDLTDATQELSTPVYRLYNPNSGEHLFTTNENECDSLDKNGWDYETIAWYAPSTGDPVFRLYNPNHPLGDHHYTSSEEERDNLIKQGWKLDATAFNTVAEGELLGAPVYSLYNPNAYDLGMATHHLTLSEEEADGLELLGWTNEGPKFYEYAEDLDPEVEELTVSIDNTTPKVGDTLTATVTGAAAATYQWLADGKEITGANDAILFVDEDYIGSKLSVEVTDEDGNTAVSDETARVTADKSDDVSIVDRMGLQSDGTGIIGDRLALSYGSDFGTPTAITWYRDGVVLTSYGAGNSNLNQDGALWLNVTAARGVGTYKATVVADGETYVTNEIVITKAEEQATILDFTMDDDYTDGTDVTYGTDDNKVVVTATLNKNYAGIFKLYKANDSKYSSALNRFSTNTAAPEKAIADYLNTATAPQGIGNNASVLTTDTATNYDALNLNSGVNRAVGHINADGSVTYKFVATAGTFTRGEDYVIAFDQTSILTDTPGTGIANVSDAATVPYVVTPAKLAVTKVARDNSPEVTFYGEDGDVLSWYGKSTNGAALTTAGIASAQIYKSTEKTNDPKASTVGVLETGVTNRNGDALDSGVWSAPVGVVADNTAYWFAQVTTTKGIFAKDAVTITSEAVQTAQVAATMINLTEKATSSTSDAKTATASFENLRTPGTVYIVRGFKQWNETTTAGSLPDTDRYSTAADIYSAYTAGISEAIVGQTRVEAGTNSVDIANAISEWKPEQARKSVAAGNAETWYGNHYIAVFIPDDEENYGMTYTSDGLANSNNKKNDDSAIPATTTDSQGLTIGQAATSISFDKASVTGTIQSKAGTTPANSGVLVVTDGTKYNTLTDAAGAFYAKDQFGTRMQSAVAAKAVDKVEVVNKDITNAEQASATYACDGNGDVTVEVTVLDSNAATALVDRGDGFKVTVLGTVIEVTNTIINPANAAAAVGALHDTTTWTVKVGSDTLCAPTTALANKEAEATAIKNLASTDINQVDNAATATAVHFTTAGWPAAINLAGATATATSNNSLDSITGINVATGTITTTAAKAGEVITTVIETALGNKVTVKVTTGNAVATSISANQNFTLTANSYTSGAAISIANNGNWDAAPTIKDQYGNNFTGTATFASTTIAGSADTTKTLTATVANGTISSMSFDANLATSEAGVFSDGSKTITVTAS